MRRRRARSCCCTRPVSMREPKHRPASTYELFKRLPEPSWAIPKLFDEIVAGWISWGAEYAVTASSDQLSAVIDALVLHRHRGQYTGREAGIHPNIAFSSHDDKVLVQARSDQEFLAAQPAAELGRICRHVRGDEMAANQVVAATWTVKARRGPVPGTVGYLDQRRALYPDIERLLEISPSLTKACATLANRAPGWGSPDSRADQLRKQYQRDHRKLSPTITWDKPEKSD